LKKLASLLVLAALVLAACGGGSNSPAATVDGEAITVGEIEAMIDPGDEPTIPKDTFAQFLGFAIQQVVVTTAAEAEFGIVISEADIDTEAEAIFQEANVDGLSREEFLADSGVTEELLRRVAHQQVLDNRVREAFTESADAPTQEQIDEALAEAESLYCASHILVATEDEANDVLDRLDSGEEFADLAAELSTDTGSGLQGGSLGCSAADVYVTEFAEALEAAEVGVPSMPVESEFGFHIILLGEDEIPTEEQLVEQLQSVTIGTATNDWFLQQVENAEVTVPERYGTWQASPVPQVVPPTE
jgi:peptidyl-prolyl cis-trans isomerase C